MTYNENLVRRIRKALAESPDFVEKKMFGGVGFLFRGNMAVGVKKDALIVRTGPERHEEALGRPHTRVFDLTGKPMRGWVMVNPGGFEEDSVLREWIEWGIETARQMPAK